MILPELITQTQTFSAGPGNDLFFLPPAYFDVFDDYDLYSTTQATLNIYDDFSLQKNQGTITPQQSFTLSRNKISQLHNSSNTPMEVTFNNYYYDLFGNINITGESEDFVFDGMVPLSSLAQYGFAVTVNGSEPLALSLTLAEASSPTVTMTFWAFSSEFESPRSITRTVTVGVETFIPLVFPRRGTYIVVFKPDAFSLLSSLRVYTDVPVYDFKDGVAETLRGTNSLVKFYKISPGNALQAFRFFMEIKSYNYVLDTSQYNKQSGVNYLGSFLVSYFALPAPDLYILPFGNGLVYPAVLGFPIYASDDFPFYISVVAEPPNDNDPSVRVIKQDLGLSSGYDFQYSIWAETLSIPALPLNTSFRVDSQFSTTNQNVYLYSTTKDTVLSINSTNGAHADFTNLETLEYYKLDSAIHNSLNSYVADLFILPAGDYLVNLHEGSHLYITELPLSTFDPPDLTQGPTTNSTLEIESLLKKPFIFNLTTGKMTRDRLIFEYLDKTNRSVDLEITFYDSQGDYLTAYTRTFEFIGNNVDPEWSVVNSSSLLTPYYNVKGLFLRVNQKSNALYNSSTSNPKTEPLLDQNDPELVSNFRIKRQDYIAYSNATDPTIEYFSLPLANVSIPELNQTLTSSLGIFTFNATQKAYRITGIATNFTISAVYFRADANNHWFLPSDVTIDSVTINGTTYDSFELELAIDKPSQYGLIVSFGPGTSINNGTFALTVEELPVYGFPEPTFTEIPTIPYPNLAEEQALGKKGTGVLDWITSNPLLSGGIGLALIAIVAGGVIFYKKRKQ